MKQPKQTGLDSEARIQQIVQQLFEREELCSAVQGVEELDTVIDGLHSEYWLPTFPIDYRVRKRFAEGASHVFEMLKSARIVSTSSKNISWEKNERLFPDLLLSSADGRFAIIEIKKSRHTERETITELLGYDHELRNHFPFFSKSDIGLVVISTEFSPILCHSLAELAVWEGRDILCLKASESVTNQINLSIYLPDAWTAIGQSALPEDAIKTVTLCLYPKEDDETEWGSLLQPALYLIGREGERLSANGFLVLWEDTWFPRLSMCKWNITIGWINPYTFLPNALQKGITHKPSSVFASLLENGEFEEMSQAYHPSHRVLEKAISILSEHCMPRLEGFSTWRQERLDPNALRNRALPIYTDCWGFLGDYTRDVFSHPASRRNFMPEVALRMLGINEPRVSIPLLDEIGGLCTFQDGHFTCSHLFRFGIILGSLYALSKADSNQDVTHTRNIEALFEWTKLDLTPALWEVRYRYLSTDEFRSIPPTIKMRDFDDKEGLGQEIEQLIAWIEEEFLAHGADAHRHWFAYGVNAYPLWEPVFSGSRNQEATIKLKKEAIQFSRFWLVMLGKKAIEEGFYPEGEHSVATHLKELYNLSDQDLLKTERLETAVFGIPNDLHIEHMQALAGMVDLVVPEVSHKLKPLHKDTPIDWSWLHAQVIKLRAQGMPHPAIGLNVDGSIVTTQLEEKVGQALRIPNLEIEVPVVNSLGGVPIITIESWKSLSQGKQWRDNSE